MNNKNELYVELNLLINNSINNVRLYPCYQKIINDKQLQKIINDKQLQKIKTNTIEEICINEKAYKDLIMLTTNNETQYFSKNSFGKIINELLIIFDEIKEIKEDEFPKLSKYFYDENKKLEIFELKNIQVVFTNINKNKNIYIEIKRKNFEKELDYILNLINTVLQK